MTTAFTRAFNDQGDFAASRAAERFLRDRGFSIGAMQAAEPRGILFGQRIVAKWRGLSQHHRDLLDGVLMGDPRNGPITLVVFAHAPAAARGAVATTRAA